jgi:hypothetical protein
VYNLLLLRPDTVDKGNSQITKDFDNPFIDNKADYSCSFAALNVKPSSRLPHDPRMDCWVAPDARARYAFPLPDPPQQSRLPLRPPNATRRQANQVPNKAPLYNQLRLGLSPPSTPYLRCLRQLQVMEHSKHPLTYKPLRNRPGHGLSQQERRKVVAF